jgi:hypothetical protein
MVVVEIEWKAQGCKTHVVDHDVDYVAVCGTAHHSFDRPAGTPEHIHLFLMVGDWNFPMWLSDAKRVEVRVE